MAADRMRQVNELLRQEISNILARDVELPLDIFVTITSVDTSRDLKHATVYITVIPDNKRISAIKAVQTKRGLIQKILGSKIKMKFTPKVHFRLDEGEIQAQKIFEIMDAPEESNDHNDSSK